MARMRDDSDRAAMIYQHEARGTDKTITNAIDTHVQAEQARRGDDEDSPSGVLVPAGTSQAIVGRLHRDFGDAIQRPDVRQQLLSLAIEPALSASPAAFASFVDKERRKWSALVQKAGVKPE